MSETPEQATARREARAEAGRAMGRALAAGVSTLSLAHLAEALAHAQGRPVATEPDEWHRAADRLPPSLPECGPWGLSDEVLILRRGGAMAVGYTCRRDGTLYWVVRGGEVEAVPLEHVTHWRPLPAPPPPPVASSSNGTPEIKT